MLQRVVFLLGAIACAASLSAQETPLLEPTATHQVELPTWGQVRVEMSRDGSRFFVAAKEFGIYDTTSGKKIFSKPNSGISIFEPDATLSTAVVDKGINGVEVVKVDDGAKLGEFELPRNLTKLGSQVVNGGAVFLIAGFDTDRKKNLLLGYKLPDGEQVLDVVIEGNGIHDLHVQDSGASAVVPTQDGLFAVDLSVDKPMATKVYEDDEYCIALAPTGDFVVKKEDSRFVVWRLREKDAGKELQGVEGIVDGLAVLGESKLLASAGALDEKILLTNPATGKPVARLGSSSPAMKSIRAISQRGRAKKVAAVDSNGRVFIWDVSKYADSRSAARSPTPPVAKLRTWRSADGQQTIKAKLIRLNGDEVTIEREDGREFTVKLSHFSSTDQAYVREFGNK